jgi:hypothetical protein
MQNDECRMQNEERLCHIGNGWQLVFDVGQFQMMNFSQSPGQPIGLRSNGLAMAPFR